MKIRDLMTRDVLTVAPETSLKEAAALLTRMRISGAPVVNETGAVVGVLSEADFLFKASGEAPSGGFLGGLFDSDVAPELKIRAVTVGEAMSSPAITIEPDRPVHEAATRMIRESVNRLPVVEGDELVGIVTRTDVVRAFTRTDAEIAEEINTEILRKTLWLERGAVTVTVVDGVARLSGEVETEADAELLPLFVERVPGVVSVRAELRSRTGAIAR
jgi:CBS domain-containing protein